MNEIVKGFVAKLNGRNVNTRKGPRTSWSIKLERENGTEVDGWISVGWDKPNYNEGDYVKVTYAKNDRGYLDASEVKLLKNDAPERQGKSTGRSAPTSGGYRVGAAADPKGPTIHYQNSRTAAIQLVGLMLEHDALPMSSAQNKAGTAKRHEEVLALVNKLTVQFFFDVETLRLLKSVADAGAIKKADKDVDLEDEDEAGDSDDEQDGADEDDDE